VSQEDLALALGRVRISGGVRLAQLEVGLDVDAGAFREGLEVVIGGGVEGQDSVPCGSSLATSAVRVGGRRGIVGRRDRVHHVFLIALRSPDLWVFSQPADERELG